MHHHFPLFFFYQLSSELRSEAAVQDSVEQSVKQFGGIDIVVNNASAISLTGTQETPMKTYDLMHQVWELELKLKSLNIPS